ncbi:MAG: DNA-protecting protein DprA [Armatimonadetes bacterium]|nr:DNA-protecting protein DprA [Armatimonadota bacterium]
MSASQSDPQGARAWLILNHSGLSVARQLALIEVFGDAPAVVSADDQALSAVPGIDRIHVQKLRRAADQLDCDAVLGNLAELGVSLLPITSAEYPRLLREIPEPPPLLYVQGQLLPRDELSVAVVGTRKCTPYGRSVSRRLGYDLAARGLTVVSGMALGIDGEAHRGALEAGGRTIAVLGCGIDLTYPRQHEDLRKEIVASGAVISELPPGTTPSRDQFPKRNRIISGLSLGVVVVEAPAGSGALITARLAAEQGREVMAIPGDITRAESRGCNELIRDGATLVQQVDDVIEALNVSPEPVAPTLETGSAPSLPPDEARVYDSLSTEPRTVDELVQATGLDSPRVMAALMLLEIKGLVRRFGGGTYARAR